MKDKKKVSRIHRYVKKRGKSRRKSKRRKSRSKSKRQSRRKSKRQSRRKSKRQSRRKSKRQKSRSNKKLYKHVKKSTKLTLPLKIYTAPGCPACTDVKKLCIKKGIKFKFYNRKDHSEYVNKKTGNCRFVPNVFNANGDYIGGNVDLSNLLHNYSLNK
jgi:glutaredoxin